MSSNRPSLADAQPDDSAVSPAPKRQRTGDDNEPAITSTPAALPTECAALPPEIWSHLVPFLRDRDCVTLRATCRFLRQAVDAYQQVLDLKVGTQRMPSLFRYLSCKSGLRLLLIDLRSDVVLPSAEDLAGAFVHCPLLRSFYFEDPSCRNLPVLARAITLAGRQVSLSLQKLFLSCHLFAGTEAYLTPLAAAIDYNCPLLRSLTVQKVAGTGPSSLECNVFLDLLPSLQNIRSLQLRNVPLTDSLLEKFLTKHPALDKLEVNFARPPVGLPVMLRHVRLRRASFLGLSPGSSSEVLGVLAHAELRRLELCYVDLTNGFFAALDRCVSLQELHLKFPAHFVETASVSTLVDRCARFESLVKLHFGGRYDPKPMLCAPLDFGAIARRCTLLRHLKIHVNLSPAAIVAILDAFASVGHRALRKVSFRCRGELDEAEAMLRQAENTWSAVPVLDRLSMDLVVIDVTTEDEGSEAMSRLSETWRTRDCSSIDRFGPEPNDFHLCVFRD